MGTSTLPTLLPPDRCVVSGARCAVCWFENAGPAMCPECADTDLRIANARARRWMVRMAILTGALGFLLGFLAGTGILASALRLPT